MPLLSKATGMEGLASQSLTVGHGAAHAQGQEGDCQETPHAVSKQRCSVKKEVDGADQLCVGTLCRAPLAIDTYVAKAGTR